MNIIVKVTFIDNGYAILENAQDISIEDNILSITEKGDISFTETMRYIKSIEIKTNPQKIGG